MRHALLGLLFVPLSALADPVLVDRIAATIDLHVITRAAVEARARPRLADAKTPEAKQQLRLEATEQLIDEWLISDDAMKQGLRVSDEEVDSAFREVGKQNGLTEAQLSAEVRKQGYEVAGYRELLRYQLLELRWLMLKVPRDGEPADPRERAEWTAKQKQRLVQELRARSVIEVRP